MKTDKIIKSCVLVSQLEHLFKILDMQVPPEVKESHLKQRLSQITEELKCLFVDITGENLWPK